MTRVCFCNVHSATGSFDKLEARLLEQTMICLHVDDLLMTSRSEACIDNIVNQLRMKYGAVACQKGERLPYFGMTIDLKTPGEVSLFMNGYVQEIPRVAGNRPTSATPALCNLFEVRDEEPLSDKGTVQRVLCISLLLLMYVARRYLCLYGWGVPCRFAILHSIKDLTRLSI
jgi:hypothetical protein